METIGFYGWNFAPKQTEDPQEKLNSQRGAIKFPNLALLVLHPVAIWQSPVI
jgi:hypothetical protein